MVVSYFNLKHFTIRICLIFFSIFSRLKSPRLAGKGQKAEWVMISSMFQNRWLQTGRPTFVFVSFLLLLLLLHPSRFFSMCSSSVIFEFIIFFSRWTMTTSRSKGVWGRETRLQHDTAFFRFCKRGKVEASLVESQPVTSRVTCFFFEIHRSVLSSQSKFGQLSFFLVEFAQHWFWKFNLAKVSVLLWPSLILWFWKTRGKHGTANISVQQVSVGCATVGLFIDTWNVHKCNMDAIRHHQILFRHV